MTASNAIVLSLIISVLLIVFSLGARSSLNDALYLFRRPALLLRAVTALYIIVPAFALAVCLAFDLSNPVKFALIALSISPLPPILPIKQMKVGGDESYTIGLLVAASLIALVATPLLLSVATNAMNVEAAISPARVARTMALTVALPLALGMLLKAFAPKAADAVRDYAMKIGMVLLVIGLVVILFAEWRAIVGLIGDGSLLAIAATVGVGLLAGHLLGGGSGGGRSVLALAAATRHPGIAIAIATINFPEQKVLAIAAVLLYLLVNVIVSVPYVRWAKRSIQQEPPTKP